MSVDGFSSLYVDRAVRNHATSRISYSRHFLSRLMIFLSFHV